MAGTKPVSWNSTALDDPPLRRKNEAANKQARAHQTPVSVRRARARAGTRDLADNGYLRTIMYVHQI